MNPFVFLVFRGAEGEKGWTRQSASDRGINSRAPFFCDCSGLFRLWRGAVYAAKALACDVAALKLEGLERQETFKFVLLAFRLFVLHLFRVPR